MPKTEVYTFCYTFLLHLGYCLRWEGLKGAADWWVLLDLGGGGGGDRVLWVGGLNSIRVLWDWVDKCAVPQ